MTSEKQPKPNKKQTTVKKAPAKKAAASKDAINNDKAKAAPAKAAPAKRGRPPKPKTAPAPEQTPAVEAVEPVVEIFEKAAPVSNEWLAPAALIAQIEESKGFRSWLKKFFK